MSGLQYESVYGAAAAAHLQGLADLRMRVFHDFPYLYQGDLAYETKYLRTYFEAPESLVVLAWDKDALVGASTAIPLRYEEESLKEAFRKQEIPIESVMYFGESILLKPFRSQGAGKEFFARRLAHAAKFPAIDTAAFCAVLRAADHPLKPADYRPLDTFWTSLGFAPVRGMTGQLTWRDSDETEESPKPMQFWLRKLGQRL